MIKVKSEEQGSIFIFLLILAKSDRSFRMNEVDYIIRHQNVSKNVVHN